MIYNTGSKDDWDYISRITQDPTWTWEAMAPYRDLNQKYVPPNDGHDDVSQCRALPLLLIFITPPQTNQYLPAAHSRNGMVHISLPGYPWQAIDSRVVAATAETALVSEFPFQRDMNTGNTVRFITVTLPVLSLIAFRFGKQIGFGWIQCTIGNGQRSSSATTYIGPDYINRPNLHVLLHAHATKLLEAACDGTTTPRFNGVEFGTEPSGKLTILRQPRASFCLQGTRSKVASYCPQRGHSERGSVQHPTASYALRNWRSSRTNEFRHPHSCQPPFGRQEHD